MRPNRKLDAPETVVRIDDKRGKKPTWTHLIGSETVVCSTCSIPKKRHVTNRSVGTNKICVDDQGHSWHKQRCPSCVAVYYKQWRAKKGMNKPRREAVLTAQLQCKSCKKFETVNKEYRQSRFINSAGRRWNGEICPTCMDSLPREKSNAKRDLLGPELRIMGDNEYAPEGAKIRICQRCENKTMNYRICNTCMRQCPNVQKYGDAANRGIL